MERGVHDGRARSRHHVDRDDTAHRELGRRYYDGELKRARLLVRRRVQTRRRDDRFASLR
jgi:hypothetical protein